MNATSTIRKRNPRGRGSDLREEVISAAIALIDETGDSTVSLRGVARRAGVSAPSLYAHFANLAELTDAVLASSFEQLRDEVHEAIKSQTDPARALAAAGAAYIQFGWDHRARYRLMFAASGYSPDAVASFTLVASTIDACVKSGASESVDPRADAFLVWVAMHGMATLEKPGRDDLRRLGPLDRPAISQEMIRRLARLR
jgi:AcrR family transcriptional regulator